MDFVENKIWHKIVVSVIEIYAEIHIFAQFLLYGFYCLYGY